MPCALAIHALYAFPGLFQLARLVKRVRILERCLLLELLSVVRERPRRIVEPVEVEERDYLRVLRAGIRLGLLERNVACLYDFFGVGRGPLQYRAEAGHGWSELVIVWRRDHVPQVVISSHSAFLIWFHVAWGGCAS